MLLAAREFDWLGNYPCLFNFSSLFATLHARTEEKQTFHPPDVGTLCLYDSPLDEVG